MLFSEYPDRDRRLADIARFIATNKIHVVALQEVVGGELDSILAALFDGSPVDGNTAEELKKVLKNSHGQNYNLATAESNGVSGVLSVYNAVLSRCRITTTKVKALPKAPELEIGFLEIELGRSALMTRLRVPGFGFVNLYDTHLCGSCGAAKHLEQTKAALGFINSTQKSLSSGQVLFAGDFNINVSRIPTDRTKLPAPYRLITNRTNGFVDSYARYSRTALASRLFCLPGRVERGCTYGVSSISDPVDPDDNAKQRIDFIFGKGPLVIKESKVFFNPKAKDRATGKSVSDHSGLVTRYGLP
jgi:maltose 6'-phosphate phosphatase